MTGLSTATVEALTPHLARVRNLSGRLDRGDRCDAQFYAEVKATLREILKVLGQEREWGAIVTMIEAAQAAQAA